MAEDPPILLQYENPPIVEVVCGILFDEMLELDLLLVGAYWRSRKDKFPEREIQPGISPFGIQVQQGLPPLRAWLISGDKSFVLQIQRDRLYFNWRARGQKEYPRFSKNNGVLERTLQEITDFNKFCETEIGKTLSINAIQVAKIDEILHGKHWTTKEDLAAIVPCLDAAIRMTWTGTPLVYFKLRETDNEKKIETNLSIDLRPPVQQESPICLRFETTVQHQIKTEIASLQPQFEAANKKANDIFFGLISKEVRERLFGTRTNG